MRAQNGRIWAKLHGGKFEVRGITEADLEEALDVLDRSFFINESVCVACEIGLPNAVQARKELRELCKITAQDGVSLLVKETESGRVVAVAFNKLQFTPPPGEEYFFLQFRKEQVHSSQAKCLMNFMIETDGRIDVCSMLNMDCFLELMFLATLPEFERLGLGRNLAKCTIELTRELSQGLGLDDINDKLREYRPAAVTALWTSRFSQKLGKDTGFQVLNTVPYTEFSYNGKRFDERIDPMHKFCEHVAYKL
ncbi:uncharacterized protein Dwil_GK14520 [Drosophila willistoni]|uniref:N-acetyltransferase domain-containing protein n=1 Tax=Drosophila willistoni TaxID=7260 RepID=B4NKM4_DROWI|nr:uncharacterized protein LOC6650310 [Drosophila willistoni]EDW85196.1 uncharacterized protein Dwil_GK14520 [Drosophila willistoni]